MFIPIFMLKLGVINSQFYSFLRLCNCKEFFVSQMVSIIVLLKNKGCPLKILLKRTRGLLNKEKFLLEFQHLEYSEWFCIKSCKWGVSCKPHLVFVLLCCPFLCVLSILLCFSVISLCCLLLASSMAESVLFQICNRNSVCRLVFSLAFTTVGSWWSQWEVVIEKSLSYMLLLMVPEQVRDWHCCSYCFHV